MLLYSENWEIFCEGLRSFHLPGAAAGLLPFFHTHDLFNAMTI